MTLIPARFTIDLTAAIESGEDGMSVMWDRLHEALETVSGVFSEGGSSSLMGRGDLIDGSPLDRYLKETT